jgi:hypothetical protein
VVRYIAFSLCLVSSGVLWLGCEAQDQSAGVKERISLGNNASADNLAPDETVKEPDPEPDLVVEEEETPKVESPEEEDPVPSDDPALLLQEGQQIYAERCESCHGAIAESERKGRSEQQILDASSVNEHSGVTWPSADEAKALAAALAE